MSNSDLNKIYTATINVWCWENTYWYEFTIVNIRQREREKEKDKREKFLTSLRQFILSSAGLCSPLDDVNSAICVHRRRQLAYLQRERRLLKRLLHCAPTEGPEVTAALRRTAIAVLRSEFGKRRFTGYDLFSISCQQNIVYVTSHSKRNILFTNKI